MKKSTKWTLGIVGGLMLLGTIKEASNPNGEVVANSGTNRIQGEEDFNNYLRANTIMADYKENEFTANKKYKGKTILVFGGSSKVLLDFSDDPYITLDDEGLRHVRCEINKDDKALGAISEGNSVWLVCKGAGEVSSSPMMRNCRVTQVQ